MKIRHGFVSNSSSSSFVIAYNNGVPLLNTVLGALRGSNDTDAVDEEIETLIDDLELEIKIGSDQGYIIHIKDRVRALTRAQQEFDNVVCITWERGDETVPDLLRALHQTGNIQIVKENG